MPSNDDPDSLHQRMQRAAAILRLALANHGGVYALRADVAEAVALLEGDSGRREPE